MLRVGRRLGAVLKLFIGIHLVRQKIGFRTRDNAHGLTFFKQAGSFEVGGVSRFRGFHQDAEHLPASLAAKIVGLTGKTGRDSM